MPQAMIFSTCLLLSIWSAQGLSLQAKLPKSMFLMIKNGSVPDEHCSPAGGSASADTDAHFLGTVDTVSGCAALALQAGADGFTYESIGRHAGTCFKETFTVTQTLWLSWVVGGTAEPTCPGGGWNEAPFMDTYAFPPGADERLALWKELGLKKV